MVSDFQSESIDDVVSYLFGKSLTSSIMTIQIVGKNELSIMLQNESKYDTNITDSVIEAISSINE